MSEAVTDVLDGVDLDLTPTIDAVEGQQEEPPQAEDTEDTAKVEDEAASAEAKPEDKPVWDKEANNLRQEMANLRKLMEAQNKPTAETPTPAPSAVKEQIAKIIEGVKASNESEITPAMANALEKLAEMMGTTLEKYEQGNEAAQKLVAERQAVESANQYWSHFATTNPDLRDARTRFENHVTEYANKYPEATPEQIRFAVTDRFNRENEVLRAKSKQVTPPKPTAHATTRSGPQTQQKPMAKTPYDLDAKSLQGILEE